MRGGNLDLDIDLKRGPGRGQVHVLQLTAPVLDTHGRAVAIGSPAIQAQFIRIPVRPPSRIPELRPAGGVRRRGAAAGAGGGGGRARGDKAEIPEVEKALNLKMKETGRRLPRLLLHMHGHEQDSPVFEDEYQLQLPLRDPGHRQAVQLKFYDDNAPMPDTLLGVADPPGDPGLGGGAPRPGPGGAGGAGTIAKAIIRAAGTSRGAREGGGEDGGTGPGGSGPAAPAPARAPLAGPAPGRGGLLKLPPAGVPKFVGVLLQLIAKCVDVTIKSAARTPPGPTPSLEAAPLCGGAGAVTAAAAPRQLT
eukprot:tig00000391_g24853.t1